MIEALEANPFEERTHRRIVDAGHTFSPRLEAASGFQMRHGEAVAIDLALSTTIAARLGILDHDASARILGLITATGLPTTSPHLTVDLCRDALIEAVSHRGGQLHLPLFAAVGRPQFVESREDVEAVLGPALSDLRSPPHRTHHLASAI